MLTGGKSPNGGGGDDPPPPSGSAENSGLTPGAVTEAVVKLMRAANPGVEPDTALAASIAGGIQPMLTSALLSGRAATAQEALSGPIFATAVTQYFGSPDAGYVNPETRKAMLAQLERINPASAEAIAMARSLGLDPAAVKGDNAGNARAAGQSGDLGSITSGNYDTAGALFKNAGLDYGVFDSLRGKGFNAMQILAAVGLTKDLGIDLNRNAVSVAILKRELPGVEKELIAERDLWHEVGELHRKAADADKRGDHEGAEQFRQQERTKNEEAERRRREYQERAGREHPDLVPHLKGVQKEIHDTQMHLDAALAGETPEARREDKRIYEAAHRHPEDAEAQKKLEEMKARRPTSSRRFKLADDQREKAAAAGDAKAVNTQSTGAKVQATASDTGTTDQRTDARLALAHAGRDALNDDEGQPEAEKADTKPPKPSRPVQSTQNTKVAPANQPKVS